MTSVLMQSKLGAFCTVIVRLQMTVRSIIGDLIIVLITDGMMMRSPESSFTSWSISGREVHNIYSGSVDGPDRLSMSGFLQHAVELDGYHLTSIILALFLVAQQD